MMLSHYGMTIDNKTRGKHSFLHPLIKKVWTLAYVIAAAGVGFTDYIAQVTL